MVKTIKNIQSRNEKIISTLTGNLKLSRKEVHQICKDNREDLKQLKQDTAELLTAKADNEDLKAAMLDYVNSITSSITADYLNEQHMSKKAYRLEQDNTELRDRVAELESRMQLQFEQEDAQDD